MALTKVSGEVIQSPFNVGVLSATSLKVGTAVTIGSGIVTAISFRGDGSSLSGIVTTKNVTIGTRTTAATISVVGTGMTLSLRSGVGTINF